MKGCVNFRPNNFAGWEHRMLQAEALDPEAVEMLSHCYEMILKDLV
jgi:hypothetical protein